MTLQDFELLCALNATRSTALGWSREQVALICEACAAATFEEQKKDELAH